MNAGEICECKLKSTSLVDAEIVMSALGFTQQSETITMKVVLGKASTN
jgi:hypothetical protein